MSSKPIKVAAVTGSLPVATVTPKLESSATFSPCRQYRYSLWRHWGDPASGYAMFVGLNPSTADETENDRTVNRCIEFAKAWGYAGLCMTNLFAIRTRWPSEMKKAAEPVGADNDQVLRTQAKNAGVVVAAWGVDGAYRGRDSEVLAMLPNLHYLKLTKDGHPGHPLYLLQTLKPQLLSSVAGK